MVNSTLAEDQLTDLYDFFENAPVGVQLLAADGTVRFANHAQLRMTGYAEAPGEYVGRPFGELLADHDAADRMRDAWATQTQGENLRTALRRRDGSAFAVVIHANGWYLDGELQGVCCFALRVPPAGPMTLANRPAEDLAGRSDGERDKLFAVFSAAFDNAPVGLHIVGPDGIVRRANRIELETLGFADDPQAYIGHHIAEFHADQAVIDDMLERLVAGRPLTHYRATLRNRSGAVTPVVIYSSPRFSDGEFRNTRCFTFPKTVDTEPAAPSFGWPRNDENYPQGPAAGDLTNVLQRLAGRKHAEESLGFLASISQALITAADYRDGLEVLCRLAVPFLADRCRVELLEHGTARTLASEGAGDGAGGVGEETIRVTFTTRDGVDGTLVLTRDDERSTFGPADRALADELARRVAIGVETGQLRQRLAARSAG